MKNCNSSFENCNFQLKIAVVQWKMQVFQKKKKTLNKCNFALQNYKCSLKIEKYHTKAHWRLGRCYEITRQWELAWKAYLNIYNIQEAKEKILSLRPFIMGSHFINVEQSLNISNPNFCVT